MNPSSAVTRDLLAIGLNLIWPGIGQMHQGRRARGVVYFLSTLGLFILLLSQPDSRPIAFALLGVAVWSIVDLVRLGPVRS